MTIDFCKFFEAISMKRCIFTEQEKKEFNVFLNEKKEFNDKKILINFKCDQIFEDKEFVEYEISFHEKNDVLFSYKENNGLKNQTNKIGVVFYEEKEKTFLEMYVGSKVKYIENERTLYELLKKDGVELSEYEKSDFKMKSYNIVHFVKNEKEFREKSHSRGYVINLNEDPHESEIKTIEKFNTFLELNKLKLFQLIN